jgi:hypothetical protein
VYADSQEMRAKCKMLLLNIATSFYSPALLLF